MLILFRVAVLLCLLAAGVSFALYAYTGDARYRQVGWRVLMWTLLAAFAFFAVMIADRVFGD